MKTFDPVVVTRLIKEEDLNHHGTLFAGRMASWLVESCFLSASRAVGKPEDIVCVKIHGMEFKRPAHKGEILEISSQVVLTGRSSITVAGQGLLDGDDRPAVTGMATFVSVKAQGKPYPHGIVLSEEYVKRVEELNLKAQELTGRRR